MAVPKRKTTPSRRGMRRAHDRIRSGTYVEDKETSELHLRHHVDRKTGLYRGQLVIEVKEDDV